MPKLLTVIFLLFISVKVSGQTWEVGAALGGFGYMGDLNTNNPVKINQPAASVFGKYNFNGYIAAKLSFTLGNIRGADSTSNDEQVRNRNLSFYTPLRELALLAEFNFMKYIPEAGKNKFTPYVFLGAGITSYAPRTRANGDVVSLRHLRTEGQENEYGTRTAVIPFGAGFKYNFTGKCTVAAELGYRYTFTDYLDDVSGVYAQSSRLPLPQSVAMADRSGERLGYNIGTPGSQRGDFRPRDMFLFAGFTISYTFVTSKCYFDN